MKKDKITTILLVCVLVLSSSIAILAASDIGEETGESESVATHAHNEYVNKTGDTMTGDLLVPNLYANGVIGGDGSELTNLNADNIASGTIDSARLPSLDAETLDGLDSLDFAMATHSHEGSHYTKTESDSLYAPTSHTHPPGDADTLDDLDSTDFALTTHTHPPGDADTLDSLDSSDFAMTAHTHDNRYYNKTESDNRYSSISHIHPPGDSDTLDGFDSTDFAMAAHTHDSRYYLRSEVDMYFLNLSGGTLMGDLNLPNLYASGVVSGDGSSLTNLNASYISTGTIDLPRLPPNIDADTLDTFDSTDFAMAAHTHDNRYYNKTESDARFALIAHTHDASDITGGDLAIDNLTVTSDIATGGNLTIGGSLGVTGSGTFNDILNSEGGLKLESSAGAPVLCDPANAGYLYFDLTDLTFKGCNGSSWITLGAGNNVGVVPIGSIIAWNKDILGCPTLPANFVECNGSIINDPESPLNGQTLPDLNGENRFLRGSSASGGIGGNDTHNHQWLENAWPGHRHIQLMEVADGEMSYSYNSAGTQVPIDTAGLYYIDNAFFTNKVDGKPPYYDVVWVMRIK